MKRKVALIIVFALVLTAFVGCGGSKTAENEMSFNWNIGADPKTIDPQISASVDGAHIINNTFEGLTREIGGKIVPALAETWDISADKLTYTFHLRDSLWSDGQPLKASDFVYAWKRGCDPNLAPEPSEYSYMFYYIKGAQDAFENGGSLDKVAVSAPDDKTLVVTLVAPTPYFLDVVALAMFMPVRQDVVEKDPAAWARTPELAISNGPFKLTSYKPGDRLELVKNDKYWQADSVKLTKIVGLMVVDPTTQLSAFQAGDMDLIDRIPQAEITKLKANDPNFHIVPQVSTYYYSFNTQKAPFNDVKVREALSLAIDRTAIVEKVTQGGEIPATGIVALGVKDSTGKEFRTTSGDFGILTGPQGIEKAKQLLAEAGFPSGKGFPTVEILYNTDQNHKAIGEAIQQMWKTNLGINTTLKNEEWAVFQDDRKNGNFMVARDGWIGDFSDPITFLDLFYSKSILNNPHYKNPNYDALIDKSKITTGADRDAAMYAAEKTIMQDMPFAPIFYYTYLYDIKEYVKGAELTKMSVWYFGNVTIEKNK